MKSEFEEFYKVLKKDRVLSAWSADEDFKDRALQLKSEVEEILEAIEKGDFENLKEEIGDSFWDLMCLCVIAEEKGKFTKDEVIAQVMEKYHRRKPYIKEGKTVSKEEELRIWQEVKKKEKEIKKQK
jgi:NTP pyrophosphatase (non-canonical NTP hydrolase)